MAIGALGGATALAFHSLLDFNLRVPSNALLFVVLLGLASAPHQEAAPPRPIKHPGLVAVALTALAAAAAWRAAGAVALDGSLSASDANLRVGRLDTTLRAHPYIAEAWRARGLAWRDLVSGKSPLDGLRLTRSVGDFDAALGLRPLWAPAWADRAWARQCAAISRRHVRGWSKRDDWIPRIQAFVRFTPSSFGEWATSFTQA